MKRLSLHEFPERLKGPVKLQAFSGLFFDSKTTDGELVFWTHSDRGPNAESYSLVGKKNEARPFLWTEYQPSLTQFKLNLATGKIEYLQEIGLKHADGKPFTGLPNHPPRPGRTGDELPVSMKGDVLNYDEMGIDAEGICFLQDHVWIAEEYGPSLLKFRRDGTLVKRFVPQGYFPTKRSDVEESLPAELMSRKLNRGFEGMTCSPEKIYLALQSPLPGDGTHVRILEFDVATETVARSLLYPLDSKNTDKIGDIALLNGQLLVIEQNDEIHNIYQVDLPSATAGAPMNKRLFVDLVKEGFDFAEKVEGLAVVGNEYLAVVNDNDFGLTGEIDEQHQPKIDPAKRSVLGLIKLRPSPTSGTRSGR